MRSRPLPTRPATGALVVPQVVVDATMRALALARGAGGRHEQLVLWAGRQAEADRLVVAALHVPTDRGPQHVHVDARAVGAAGRAIRRHRLTLVAQVHSHPGWDTRHSDGDDDLIVMRHEGMFSLVVADYGDTGFLPGETVGVHQLQAGRWVAVEEPQWTVAVVPTEVPVSL